MIMATLDIDASDLITFGDAVAGQYAFHTLSPLGQFENADMGHSVMVF